MRLEKCQPIPPIMTVPVRFGGLEPTEPKIDYLIDGILPKGYLCFLGGNPKVGKTCLATAIALAVASGTPFLGKASQRTNVLYLSLDENWDERAQSMNFASREIRERLLEEDSPKVHQAIECPPIDTVAGVTEIGLFAHREKCGLVIIDCLHAATSGFSLYDSHAARRALEGLKRLCDRTGLTVMILHCVKPTRLGFRLAESPQLAVIPGLVMIMDSVPPPRFPQETGEGVGGGATRYFTLRCQGRGRFANRTWHLRSNDPLHYEPYEPELDPTTDLRPAEQAVLKMLATNAMTTNELIAATGIASRTVSNAITKLIDEQRIVVDSVTHGRRKYGLPQRNDEENEENEEMAAPSDLKIHPHDFREPKTEIAAMVSRAFLTSPDFAGVDEARFQPERLETDLQRGTTFVARDEGRMVGALTLSVPKLERECETFRGASSLTYLAVEPSESGRGVAKALMDEVERYASHFPDPHLAVSAPKRIPRLIAFYERRGYREAEEMRWLDAPDPSVVMVKNLKPREKQEIM